MDISAAIRRAGEDTTLVLLLNLARASQSCSSTKAPETNFWKPNSNLSFWKVAALEPVSPSHCGCTEVDRLGAKQLGLLRELVPNAIKIAMLLARVARPIELVVISITK